MHSIFDKTIYDQLVGRIQQLSPDTENRWGKMNVNEMLCHVTDPLRDVLGIRQIQPVTPPEMRPKLIGIVITENEWPQNLQSFPPYLQHEEGGGTKPTTFVNDKKSLLYLLDKLHHAPADFQFYPHAGLGTLTREQCGHFAWKHLDHHLRQFGV